MNTTDRATSDAGLVICVVTIGVVALGARVGHLDAGWIGNELANLRSLDRWWAPIVDRENGVNPPLLRVLINLLPEAWVLPGGRVLSMLCTSLVASLSVVLTRRWSGSLLLATLCGLVLALHPLAVFYGTLARSYGLWMAVFTLTILAADRGRSRALALGLALQPWCHYLPMPVTALTALWAWRTGRIGRRQAAAVGASWIPLVLSVLLHGEARSARTPVAEGIRFVTELGWSHWWPQAATVGLVTVVVLQRSSEPLPTACRAMAAAHGVLIVAASAVHIVRPPVALFVLVPLVLAVGARRTPWSLAAMGLALWWSAREVVDPIPREPVMIAVPRMAAQWPEIRARSEGETLVVHRGLGSLIYAMEGRHPCTGSTGGCGAGHGYCQELQGQRVCPPGEPGAYHLTLGAARPGCELVLQDEAFYLQWCP